ncbi:unnamed protein product [Coffea canephora]|uniref:Uncharacterized protein n=1 Tax=Coffea canephora TaxID=49390 RepID=A0A068UH87_COFCA|nr:unnamed protein product [Coffea canephora]
MPFIKEVKPQAPMPLHPPFMKCNGSTQTWPTKLHASSKNWKFRITNGKLALGIPISVQNLYPYTNAKTRVVKRISNT